MWQFSDHFATSQPARVARLNAWRSYMEIVDAVRMSAKVGPGGLCWQPRKSTLTDAHRVECDVQVSAEAADALFNSPHGYRAMYARSVACGEGSNRQLIQALMQVLWPASGQVPPDHVLSLKSPQAKVWMEQDRRVTAAIKGETLGPPVVEIAYRPWLEELGTETITRRGSRWLARGGVLASAPTRCVIALKGAWVTNRQAWTDPSKAARSEQLHRFGFS